MASDSVLNLIQERFADGVIITHTKLGENTAVVSKATLIPLASALKEEWGFNFLMDITAVDYLKRNPRFEVVYHFMALETRQRLRVKVPTGGLEPEVDSLSSTWPNANWFEREVWDMFGIRFSGHPDMRRILLYPEFKGHPLRKDYRFNKRQPLIGPQD